MGNSFTSRSVLPEGIDGYRINPDGTLTQIITLTGLDGLQDIAVT